MQLEFDDATLCKNRETVGGSTGDGLSEASVYKAKWKCANARKEIRLKLFNCLVGAGGAWSNHPVLGHD